MAKREFDVPTMLQQVTALLNGLKAGTLAGLTEVLVGGTVYKIADLVTALQAVQAMLQAVVDAETGLAKAVETLNDQGPAAEKLLKQTRKSVKAQLGAQSASLPQFGLKADKVRTPLTAQQNVTKVERNLATREARHTMGTAQKAKVHGDVPAAGPAAPAASPPATAPVKAAS